LDTLHATVGEVLGASESFLDEAPVPSPAPTGEAGGLELTHDDVRQPRDRGDRPLLGERLALLDQGL
jgi:hypothetical protein